MKALNIKRMDTEAYRTYRVLRAPPALGDIYRARIRNLGAIKGALIFPESLLAITHKIFSVNHSVTNNSASFQVNSLTSQLQYAGNTLTSLEDILEVENSVPSDRIVNMFTVGGNNLYANDRAFMNLHLFSNRESVSKYVLSKMPSVLNDLKG